MRITKWNDPQLVALNPRLASHDKRIGAVIRSDGAGESYVFSQYCMTVAPDVWNAFVSGTIALGNQGLDQEFTSHRPTSLWPAQPWPNNGLAIPQNAADGAANYVADPSSGADTITYVAAGYADVRHFPVASVENGAHQFTQPNEDNVTIALSYATPVGNGTFNIKYDGPDARAYFPSTYSYVLVQTKNFDPAKGATLGQFLCYAVGVGQQAAPQLRYARLSNEIQHISVDAIEQIPGAPPRSACPVGGYTDFHLILGVGAPAPPSGGSNGLGGPGSGSVGGSNNSIVNGNNAAGKKNGGTKAAGANNTAGGGAGVTTTTVPSADQLLANTPIAASGTSGGKGISAVWILLAGAAAAWVVTFVLNKRKASA